MSDEFWTKIKLLLPVPKPKKKPGKPLTENQSLRRGIFISFVLVNGKLCHDFMELQALYMIDFRNDGRSGFFEKMWIADLLEYDNKNELEWEWQAIDGAMAKTLLGGAGTGANPTDRGKKYKEEYFNRW